MWIVLADKEREYVINFNNVITFEQIEDCRRGKRIEIITSVGSIFLSYETEQQRQKVYEDMIYMLGTEKKVCSLRRK